ncbi:hypothetical protein GCM10022221_14490 [Actinocorallia aurea]
MSGTWSIDMLRRPARRASALRERIFLTGRGEHVGAGELEDLEDALALARHELRAASGTEAYVRHEEAMRLAGFDV